MNKKLIIIAFFLVFFSVNSFSQIFEESTNFWSIYDEPESNRDGEGKILLPTKYEAYRLDVSRLKNQLERVYSMEGKKILVSLPTPDGIFIEMEMEESSIMESKLQQRFPEIRTFEGVNPNNPQIRGRFDITPHGFHGMVRTDKGLYFIDPYTSSDIEHYQVFYKKDYTPINNYQCQFDDYNLSESDDFGFDETVIEDESINLRGTLTCNTAVHKREYRLAISCTGEYAQFHGGTVNDALAAITTTINRVNEVYEIDLATRLVLINNETDIIYLDGGTDPYTNDNAGDLINESQNNITNVIGSANFDVGHTFSTGAGGLAGLGVVCSNNYKAKGVTGRAQPVGDPYDIDYVAHELGHQFGANHTFNGNSGSCSGGNRNASTAYEPGSGSTVMAYAGICDDDDLQPNTDAYFHAASHAEILDYTINGNGSTCANDVLAGNTSPQINFGTNGNTIPKSTPFIMTGGATDSDGDVLTYCWEQWDLGAAGDPDEDTSTDKPIFRTFLPVSAQFRIFPKLSDILNNTQTKGEILPSVGRDLNFRLTVRDNGTNSNGIGGLCHEDYGITVDGGSGPFRITSQNDAEVYTPGEVITVTWDVANTTASPVSCANVDIQLSTDGGQTFAYNLSMSTANDGTEDVTLPNVETTTARIRVLSSNNIFFDINNADLTISNYCKVFTSDDVPKNIPDPGSVFSQLSIANVNGNITDVQVRSLSGTHTWINDLTFDLEHPDGTRRKLFEQICNSEDDFDIKFDDASSKANGDIPCPPTDGDKYQPKESFSAFDGKSPNGTWKMNVSDAVDPDSGTLQDWSILVCVDEALPVYILSFEAKAIEERAVILNWEISDAINFSHFEIWRSENNNKSFIKIGKVDYFSGNNKFDFEDRNVKSGMMYYYKLKLVDADNTAIWSKTEVVNMDIKASIATVSPNPFLTSISIDFSRGNEEKVEVNLYDVEGNMVKTINTISSGRVNWNLGNINNGVYFIELLTSSGKQMIRIVKVD